MSNDRADRRRPLAEVKRVIRVELEPDELWIIDEVESQAKRQFRKLNDQIKWYLTEGLLRDKSVIK